MLLVRPRWIEALVVVAGVAIAGLGVQLARAARSHTQPITRLPCGAERELRSRVSDTSLELAFINETETRVTVYWIDFQGARVFYNSLAPGESYMQQTYVTHPWIVIDDSGRCLELLVPNAAGTYQVPIGARRSRPT